MSLDDPPIAEDLVLALVTRLLRKGLIDAGDIEAMCASLSEGAAHQLRCCILEAEAPTTSERQAAQARLRLHVVKGE